MWGWGFLWIDFVIRGFGSGGVRGDKVERERERERPHRSGAFDHFDVLARFETSFMFSNT